ncbi:MAG: hypothetical protein ACI4OA_09475 [Selenomonadaceae bacterium]
MMRNKAPFAALFLALAIIAQSARLIFPFIPGPVNQFVIGTVVNMVCVMAMVVTQSAWTAAMGVVLPCVAFVTGALPIAPMALVVGLGNVIYMLISYRLWPRAWVYAAPLVKAATLYAGTRLVISMLDLPESVATALSLMMSWPQVVTGAAGIFFAGKLLKRIKV